MSDDLTVCRVTREQMQQLFNDGPYIEMMQAGHLTRRIVRCRHANPARSGQPLCTFSELVDLVDQSYPDAQPVARFHWYRLPDGTIGATGRPDPVRLVIGNVVYKLPIGYQH